MINSYLPINTVICGFGILINVLLLFVIVRCPLRSLSTYKLFFLYGVLEDITASICMLVVAPIAITTDFAFLYLPTGAVSEGILAQILVTLCSVTSISSLTLAMNNFVYRYIQLCKARFLYIYHSLKWAMVIAFINVAIICNWISLLYVVLCPTPLVIQYTRKYISKNYGVDATRKAFLGLIWKYITPPNFALVIESFIVILALGTVGALCAWKIDRCLRVNAMSPQTKKIHRHMLLMLILQTVCPALLLNGPICAMYMLLFTGADSPSVLSYIMGLFMSSFTIFSPAIVLVFMKDYRNYILIALRLRKPSQITKVTASEPRSAR